MTVLLTKKNFNVTINDATNCSCTSFGNIFISKIFNNLKKNLNTFKAGRFKFIYVEGK